MLLKQKILDAIAAGQVSLVFRRWHTPGLRLGTMQSPVGPLSVESIAPVEIDSLTAEDARAAGHADLPALLAALGPEGAPVYRAELRLAADAGEAAAQALEKRLDRLDRVQGAPWTRAVLRALATAGDPAASAGLAPEDLRRLMKKLIDLGLVSRNSVGYRLSQRGEALLAVPGAGSPS